MSERTEPARDAPSPQEESRTRPVATSRFEVEAVLRAAGQAFVLARRLDAGGPVTLTPGTTLGGRPVVECLDLPPELANRPSRHETRMVFCLERAEDLSEFPTGRYVDLVLG